MELNAFVAQAANVFNNYEDVVKRLKDHVDSAEVD
jgi:hypothetical protein